MGNRSKQLKLLRENPQLKCEAFQFGEKGEGGSASLKSPRAPPPLSGRVVPRTLPKQNIITITGTINQYNAKEKSLFPTFIYIADCCVCYYNKESPCGTGQTVRMAINKGIEIFNIAENVPQSKLTAQLP